MVEAAKTSGVEALFVASPEEAGEWLVANVRAGDVVLLKASRGVRLEKASGYCGGSSVICFAREVSDYGNRERAP